MDNTSTYQKIKPYLSAILLIGVAIYFGWSMLNSNYNCVIGDSAVTIERGKGINIPFSEITDVQYFEKMPALSNRVGESIGNKRNGTFTVAGVGRGKVHITDITKPAVIIFTKDTFYAVTPSDAENFYNTLKTKIN